MKRATITEVAEAAGVSRAAVSKVLRNAYGLSDDMRRKVNEAMSALNYRPQTAARGLRGSTYTLGVLLPDIRNPFFPDILDGIVDALDGTLYQPLLGVRLSAEKSESGMIDKMMDRKLDGFIMIAPLLSHAYLAEIAREVPTVVIGRHDQGGGFDTVNNDDDKGAHMIVDYLADLGHKRIAHVSMEGIYEANESNPPAVRRTGYLNAMQKRGLAKFGTVVESTHVGGLEQDRKIARDLLSRPGRPTAVFAWTDSIAITVMAVAEEMHFRVPEDIAVVGYDNSRTAAIPQISLTSVDQSGFKIGEMATELLIGRINGRDEEVHLVTEPVLKVRRSTGR